MRKKKPPEGMYHFQDPIYWWDFCVVFGGDYTHARRDWITYRRLGRADDAEYPLADARYTDSGSDSLIWFSPYALEPEAAIEFPGLVSHECLHAVISVLSRKGIKPPRSSNDEHYTYYLEYLVNSVYTLYVKKYLRNLNVEKKGSLKF